MFFYASSPSQTTPCSLLTAAHDAIKSVESGEAIAFRDPIENVTGGNLDYE